MNLKTLPLLFLLICILNCATFERMLFRDGSQDPLCSIVDQKTNDCLACICRAYFNDKRVCKLVSDLCKTWNINSGYCTSCYVGYELTEEGTCKAIGNFDPKNDPEVSIINFNCETDDGNGKCLTCRPYYILHCNDCQTTGQNPFCSKFNDKGVCQECDPDYKLDYNNVCQGFENGNETNGNETNGNETMICEEYQNCKQCNATQCTMCDEGYRQEYYSKNCVLPTTNCKEGCALCSPSECFSCSQGYSAQSWPICINCSYMYARNSQGKCKAIQSDCSQYSNCASCVVGQCTSCVSGYILNSNVECEAKP